MLNRRGMTTVEILMVFVIIGIISAGIFSMVSSFNNKQNVESAKEKLMTFKNTVTREIEGDIIRRGLVSVKKIDGPAKPAAWVGHYSNDTLRFTFKDGSTKDLSVIKNNFEEHAGTDEEEVCDAGDGNTCTPSSTQSSCLTGFDENAEEHFEIRYGAGTNKEVYELPDLGEALNDCGHTIKDLRINNVIIDLKNNMLNIKISFTHPELSTRYAINIITPINFEDINSTYSDSPFVDSIVQLKKEISASGDVQYQTNSGGTLRGKNASGAVIGTITLKEEVTEGSEAIQERSGIKCKYYKNDTTQDFTGGVAVSNQKTTTFKGNTITTELTLKSKIAEGGTDAVHAVCTATIKDASGIEKKETWDGWIGNGIQTDPATYNTTAIDYGKYHYYYVYIGGQQIIGREARIYWYNDYDPVGHVATYYCLSGDESWYFENGQKKRGMTAQGWVRKDGNKWYYYMDHRYHFSDGVKFLGEKLTSKTFALSYPNYDSPTQPFTFDANGLCTAGQGC